ncbi:hypothetical protein AB0M20_10315 [Actinoplanes sp. NPDC051633]|uniref:hypothetical protein n=1 Tax=Actinoplanes sp. NPDC051633 TaxID=3155670 RepID=UPI0034212286
MRGGLDDALDKLARRDELRRRAVGEATGTPPPVQELVEAIAGVVGRNQSLEVTVGVEGAGDPTLLHFFVEDGMVRVTADSSVAAQMSEPRHADFDLEPEDPAEEQFAARPASPAPAFEDLFDSGHHRSGYDGQHGFTAEQADDIDAARFRSPFAATPPPPVPPQTTRPAPSSPHDGSGPRFDDARPQSPAPHESAARLHFDDTRPQSPAPQDTSSRVRFDDPRPSSPAPHESTARLRFDDIRPQSPAPHERTARLHFDDTRPQSPAPQDTSSRLRYGDPRPSSPAPAESSSRLRFDAARPMSGTNGFGEETTRLAYAPQPIPEPRAAAEPPQRSMPTPLPEPIPLRTVDSEETEQAAKRLAALLRDDPSLLRHDRP